jgi:hypothetical protein
MVGFGKGSMHANASGASWRRWKRCALSRLRG